MKTFKCYYEKCPYNKESECTNSSPVINQDGLCTIVSAREEVIVIPLTKDMKKDLQECHDIDDKKDCTECSLNTCIKDYV